MRPGPTGGKANDNDAKHCAPRRPLDAAAQLSRDHAIEGKMRW